MILPVSKTVVIGLRKILANFNIDLYTAIELLDGLQFHIMETRIFPYFYEDINERTKMYTSNLYVRVIVYFFLSMNKQCLLEMLTFGSDRMA